jgi:hypothetical protein
MAEQEVLGLVAEEEIKNKDANTAK